MLPASGAYCCCMPGGMYVAAALPEAWPDGLYGESAPAGVVKENAAAFHMQNDQSLSNAENLIGTVWGQCVPVNCAAWPTASARIDAAQQVTSMQWQKQWPMGNHGIYVHAAHHHNHFILACL